MDTDADIDRALARPVARRALRRRAFPVLGLTPFAAFVAVFLLWPAGTVFVQATGEPGGRTLHWFGEAITGQYRASFLSSVKLSLTTAVLGAVIGTALGHAITTLRHPRWLQPFVTAFSGVAANMGGIPLAFAFLSALGAQGLLTKALSGAGFDLMATGFTIYGFWGLVVVYLYFQIPLMVLVMAPAIGGMRRQWREAAEGLGASGWQYWRHVAGPILFPSFAGGVLLLFANSFSAYATAYALTTGRGNLVPVQIRFFLQGNTISGKGQLGYALAAWMIVFMAVAIGGNHLLRRRAARWMQ